MLIQLLPFDSTQTGSLWGVEMRWGGLPFTTYDAASPLPLKSTPTSCQSIVYGSITARRLTQQEYPVSGHTCNTHLGHAGPHSTASSSKLTDSANKFAVGRAHKVAFSCHQACRIAEVCLCPRTKGTRANDSGLLMVAGEQSKIMTFYVPELGLHHTGVAI